MTYCLPFKNARHKDETRSPKPEIKPPPRASTAPPKKKLSYREQQEWEERGEYWVVMLDPEGNEFCVQ